jgi:hypothetical protein
MVKKEECIKISGRYYDLSDLETVLKTRINCIIPTDLTGEETTETVEARKLVDNIKLK